MYMHYKTLKLHFALNKLKLKINVGTRVNIGT